MHPLARILVISALVGVVAALAVVGILELLGVELDTPVIAAVVSSVSASTVATSMHGRGASESA